MVNIKINGGIQNASVQIGDIAYYVPEASLSLIGEQQSSDVDPISVTYLIGEITAVSSEMITIDNPSNTPSPNDFVMFKKNESVNNTSLIGYYELIAFDFVSNPSTQGAFMRPGSMNESVNNTSLIGYYAEVQLKNESPDKAELFALSSEITESSK